MTIPDNVYIIVNEWTDIAGNTSSEVVDAEFYLSQGDAERDLKVLAEQYGRTLEEGATSLTLEDHDHTLQSEEYYIQELNRA